MMSIGFVVLTAIIFVVRNLSKQKNWMKYGKHFAVPFLIVATLIRIFFLVFTVFAFTSMIDFIIGLEFKGWISGFMSQYLYIGEPYLSSPWGCAIVIFDGIFLYSMYLMMIHRIANK